MKKTITVCIGNSDDKLSQRDWSVFVRCTRDCVRQHADVLFDGATRPDARKQSACFVAMMPEGKQRLLTQELGKLRIRYRQDSIALVIGETVFIRADDAGNSTTTSY